MIKIIQYLHTSIIGFIILFKIITILLNFKYLGVVGWLITCTFFTLILRLTLDLLDYNYAL